MSPEARYAEMPETGYQRSWSLALGAVALGLGTGMLAIGVGWPGAGVAGAGIALLGGTWVFRKKQQSGTAVAPGERREQAAIDPETGLPCPPQLTELLRREIARSQRYGDRTALAVFDVRVTGFTPDVLHPEPPSPARHIAASLVECAREADIIARIDQTHFVVMLTESDDVGAAQFAERTRTKLGTMPFARAADGKGIYVRAWAGWARWNAEFETPGAYLDAAMKQLEATRPSYEREQSWFKGDD